MYAIIESIEGSNKPAVFLAHTFVAEKARYAARKHFEGIVATLPENENIWWNWDDEKGSGVIKAGDIVKHVSFAKVQL